MEKLHNEELVLLTQYCTGYKTEKNEMGWACSVYGGQERCIQGFGGENLKEIDCLEDPGVDGRIILRWKKGCGGTDWIELAQDMDSWRALVNAVTNLRVP